MAAAISQRCRNMSARMTWWLGGGTPDQVAIPRRGVRNRPGSWFKPGSIVERSARKAEVVRPRWVTSSHRSCRRNHHHLGALADLGVLDDRDLGDGAVRGGDERVFHLHGLDDGEALATRHALALFHQDA